MRTRITLTNNRSKASTTVLAHYDSNRGYWVTEKARRAAFHRIKADPDNPNAGVTASSVLTAWHYPLGCPAFKTYTIWNS
jgi:hypothetical protein